MATPTPELLRHNSDLRLRAPSSGLDRSSPRPPLSASGPVTDIRPGRWRTRIRKFVSGHFFSEAEARDRTLSPGLPHHRHPMTADEALAGLALMLVGLPCLAYIIWRLL